MTRNVIVLIAFFLSLLPACSPPAPTSTQIPTATAAQTATFLPTPSPVDIPSPTLTHVPTVTRISPSLEVPIAEIGATMVGEELSVKGQVVESASFSHGFKFTLDDGTGELTLLTWLETYDSVVEREGLQIGALVHIEGTINLFEGDLEIVPASASDVVVVRPGSKQAPERQIGSLTNADIGKRIAISGEVARADSFSAGERVYLDDGSGQVLLLLWQNVFERIPDGTAARTAGSQLRAMGRVEEYQGTIQVVPGLPFDVEIVHKATPAPPPTSHAPPPTSHVVVPLGELDKSHIGTRVAITGQVKVTESFSKGFKFVLDDGTGQIVLLTWHNIYDELHRPKELNIGASVHITGEITQYEGELQIEPGSASDIGVSDPASTPPLPKKVGTIADHLGQRTTIVGQVVGVEETASATRLFVADESGEALVYIWNNIMERIPDNRRLRETGTRVRISGMVQEYRGELEILPALPYDAEVLD